MNNEEYEKYQLELIAIEYHARGYAVKLQSGVSNLPYKFDAIAENPEGEQVFIEIINQNLSKKTAERKLMALKAVAEHLPKAKVDFRYIDVDAAALRMARNRQGFALPKLKKILAARVPLLRQGNVAGQFLSLWQLHAAIIRAFAVSLDGDSKSNLTILDLYNELLRHKVIERPDDIVEEAEMDLFEIFDTVQLAIQGAVVEQDSFNQLRLHILEVRRQIREKLRRESPTQNGNS